MKEKHLGNENLEDASSQVEGGVEGGLDDRVEDSQPEVEILSEYDNIRNSNISSLTEKIVEHLRKTGSSESEVMFFVNLQKKKLTGSMPGNEPPLPPSHSLV